MKADSVNGVCCIVVLVKVHLLLLLFLFVSARLVSLLFNMFFYISLNIFFNQTPLKLAGCLVSCLRASLLWTWEFLGNMFFSEKRLRTLTGN